MMLSRSRSNSSSKMGKKSRIQPSKATRLLTIGSLAVNVLLATTIYFDSTSTDCSTNTVHNMQHTIQEFAVQTRESGPIQALRKMKSLTNGNAADTTSNDVVIAADDKSVASDDSKQLQQQNADLQSQLQSTQSELNNLRQQLQQSQQQLQQAAAASSSKHVSTEVVRKAVLNAEIPNDLSDDPSFNLADHSIEWNYCPLRKDGIFPRDYPFCAETPECEQYYQLSWFGSQVNVHAQQGVGRTLPDFMECVHLPPAGYVWPEKYPALPETVPENQIHWPNMRVNSHTDLITFNRGTPKNLYHFNATVYDQDAIDELRLAAQYIPFGPKVRLMLDIGAGGGSLGLVVKRKYDVTVLSTVFADWPYCEYIGERGGLCMLLDTMEPLPLAKWTFDVIHASWVYHGQQPAELVAMFHEVNRLLRPGGYMWMRGGHAQVQVDAYKHLAEALGWKVLYSREEPKPEAVTKSISFGPGLPYEKDWWVIFLKPTRPVKRSDADCAASQTHQEQQAQFVIEQANTQQKQ